MLVNYRRLKLRVNVFYSHFKLGIVRFFLCGFYFEKESFFKSAGKLLCILLNACFEEFSSN